ncbi:MULTISPECIES: pyruvate kinase [unclassified Sphingobium]|uniref:pyruvate kinase n=1 Tax=unclassified Sphingobium TaxID=2611147 RepID=UPI0007702B20|nr:MULTISPECIES: pyruvate kinase [Sphingomonadaceae]AMK25289.1 pyruvate kinase [Sphingobium sp. TKS]NML87945.1 pyruvate kinase [Sphingobium sp. TB-6]
MEHRANPRFRNVRVLATLGPASATPEIITELFEAGADAFRINMSHGTQEDKVAIVAAIRGIEKTHGRATTILFDLQGPKLRIGNFQDGAILLEKGAKFVLDSDPASGNETRVHLPHREILQALVPGARLLLDDGKLALRVEACDATRADTVVETGGRLSNCKGLNVPDVVIPMTALTDKDRRDLEFACEQGADWIALSFVQRPEDIAEARKLIAGRASLMAKIEKPAAVERAEEILELSDAVMVARGDLGVEVPPHLVPGMQKKIVETARILGRPVVVATQMLESMIVAPTPTRAEVSDVATAIYDGADVVMLSAESAAGQWPREAVGMMDSIAQAVERDHGYAGRLHFIRTLPNATTADALAAGASQIAGTVNASLIVCFTLSGSTARRISRERPPVPLLVLTPKRDTARRAGLLWGVHAVQTNDVENFESMIAKAKRMALRCGMAKGGDRIVIVAGVPFGIPGSTNMLHVALLNGNELDDRGDGPAS